MRYRQDITLFSISKQLKRVCRLKISGSGYVSCLLARVPCSCSLSNTLQKCVGTHWRNRCENTRNRLPLLEQRALVLNTEMHQPWQNVIKQVRSSLKQVYTISVLAFNTWLLDHHFTLQTVDRSSLIAYKGFLASTYKMATAARMRSVMCNLLQECLALKYRADDPTLNLRGFKADDEFPHIALSRDQVRELLTVIDTSTLKGMRDYALMLLIRTGIRRAECPALAIGDFSREQGHIIMTIEHGKGDKRRKVKMPAVSSVPWKRISLRRAGP